jgi:hypothetical protein
MHINYFSGINLDKAIQIARELGGHVRPISRTGELRFDHPLRSMAG